MPAHTPASTLPNANFFIGTQTAPTSTVSGLEHGALVQARAIVLTKDAVRATATRLSSLTSQAPRPPTDASTTTKSQLSPSAQAGIGVGVSIASLIAISIVLFLLIKRRRTKSAKQNVTSPRSEEAELEDTAVPRLELTGGEIHEMPQTDVELDTYVSRSVHVLNDSDQPVELAEKSPVTDRSAIELDWTMNALTSNRMERASERPIVAPPGLLARIFGRPR